MCLLYDIVEKYGVAREATDENITQRMRFTCRLTKSTCKHSEILILITVWRQQLLRERETMLR